MQRDRFTMTRRAVREVKQDVRLGRILRRNSDALNRGNGDRDEVLGTANLVWLRITSITAMNNAYPALVMFQYDPELQEFEDLDGTTKVWLTFTRGFAPSSADVTGMTPFLARQDQNADWDGRPVFVAEGASAASPAVRHVSLLTTRQLGVRYDDTGVVMSVVAYAGGQAGFNPGMTIPLYPAVLNEDAQDADLLPGAFANGNGTTPPVKVLVYDAGVATTPMGPQIFSTNPAGGQLGSTLWIGGGLIGMGGALTGLIDVGDWVFVRGVTGVSVPPAYQVEFLQVLGTDQSAVGFAMINGGGAVTSVTLTQQGTYTTAPTVVFQGGGGSGATATANLDGSGHVTSVTITNGGSNYTSVPTVLFEGPRTNLDYGILLNLSNQYLGLLEIFWPAAWTDFLNDQDWGALVISSPICPKDIYQLVMLSNGLDAYQGETYPARQTVQPPLSPVPLYLAQSVRTPGGVTTPMVITFTDLGTPTGWFSKPSFDPEGYWIDTPSPALPNPGADPFHNLVIPADGWYQLEAAVQSALAGVYGQVAFTVMAGNSAGQQIVNGFMTLDVMSGAPGLYKFTFLLYLSAQTILIPVFNPNGLLIGPPWLPPQMPFQGSSTGSQYFSGTFTIKGLGPDVNQNAGTTGAVNVALPWDVTNF
jgi:hypothetical protein